MYLIMTLQLCNVCYLVLGTLSPLEMKGISKVTVISSFSSCVLHSLCVLSSLFPLVFVMKDDITNWAWSKHNLDVVITMAFLSQRLIIMPFHFLFRLYDYKLNANLHLRNDEQHLLMNNDYE